MIQFTDEEKQNALLMISTFITRCEKAQLKFKEGTSQHSLLKNRLYALHVSKGLIEGADTYAEEQLRSALPPITSIIHKCEKAQVKFQEGTSNHTRFKIIIEAMYLAKSYIEEACKNVLPHLT